MAKEIAKEANGTRTKKKYPDLIKKMYDCLKEYPDGLHYQKLAGEVSKQYDSVSANFAFYINQLLNRDISESDSPLFENANETGTYKLRQNLISKDHNEVAKKIEIAESREDITNKDIKPIFPCFGMYWDRAQIAWETTSKLMGVEYVDGKEIDFTLQKGIYVLYHDRDLIYVGQAFDRSIFTRLREHTQQRLRGRWNRFSWFGIFEIDDQGALTTTAKEKYEYDKIVDTLESILIEICEPFQNRKKGDEKSVEYLQVIDPIESGIRTNAYKALNRN